MPIVRRRVAALVGAAALILVVPAPIASADSIIDLVCKTVTWKGTIMPTNEPSLGADRSYGPLKHCLTVIKMSDSNTSYDFYQARVEDEWGITNDGGYGGSSASATILTSIAATTFKSTPDIEGTQSCSSPLSVSASYLGFSITVTPAICDGAVIDRVSELSTIVRYKTADVRRTKVWDYVYMIKVAQGRRPKLTASVNYPLYTIRYDPDCGNQGCWKNGEVWASVSVTIPT